MSEYIKKRIKLWHYSILFGFVFATVIASSMMYAAWDLNPQGAIHNELGVEWKYWLLIGGSWFITVFIIIFICSFLLFYVIKKFANSSKKQASGL